MKQHHPTHRLRRLSLDLFMMGWRGFASAIGVIHPPVLVQKPLRNQLVHYYIISRGVFMYQSFETP